MLGLLRWRRRCFDARLRAVGQQVWQGQAQAVPTGIGKLAPQRADGLWPIGIFAGTGENNQGAFGLGGVGWLPQGQEAVAAGLQGLLFSLRNLALQGQGIFLAAFGQRLAFDSGRFAVGSSFWRFASCRLCGTR
ncbi:hypothetical protein D9M71_668180 [compost metagenome]